MILSHAHRFIYVKTYKTASTSIESALAAVCGPEDVITPASDQLMQTREGERAQNWRLDHPLVPPRPLWRRLLGRPERRYHQSVGFYEHMPASRIRDYVGEQVWRDYYKFSFERNPWDRQVSWYYYKTKSKEQRPSFDKFLADRRRAYVENYDLYSLDGRVALDFVGQYETLVEDFGTAVAAIGLPAVTLPRTNVSPDQGRDYRRFYRDETRDRMADWYAREIEAFGYAF